MFLSKVSLISSTQTSNELARLQKNGAYASHQLIWNLFTRDKKRQFLFREEQGINGMPQYFVLSRDKPQSESPIFDIQSKVFAPSLKAQQRLVYKLRVNPTICIKDETGRQRRHDVMMHAKRHAKKEGIFDSQDVRAYMEQAAISWLSNEKRLTEWGISLDYQPEVECYKQHRSQKKGGHCVQFSSVDFQGCLTISEPKLFLRQYQEGFGRAKGMGCGLMLIKPVG